ncbi:MAG: flagellar biosynthesis anti-sigma factor FlgM [Deltaproteobacteria bacterium]|nr:MAG: flagellar biosynthesis anti-sigma factor FlgM [Deltaproteobacteria bacterium]
MCRHRGDTAMKIDYPNDELAMPARLQTSGAAPTGRGARAIAAYSSGESVSPADSASVSHEAKQLSTAVSTAQRPTASEDLSSARLAALRQQVRDGSLPVDPMKLADAMMRDEGLNG